MSGFLGSGSGGAAGGGASDGYQGLSQTLFVELAADGYTIAREPNFSTLLSQSIITAGGNLLINFSASFGANTSLHKAIFRVLIDDILQRSVSTGFDVAQTTQSVAIVFHKTVASGIHTIVIEWGKSTIDQRFATLRILAGTETNVYHASLLIQEVE